jgi:hypothetical protein
MGAKAEPDFEICSNSLKGKLVFVVRKPGERLHAIFSANASIS